MRNTASGSETRKVSEFPKTSEPRNAFCVTTKQVKRFDVLIETKGPQQTIFHLNFFRRAGIPSLKLTFFAPENRPKPKRKRDRIPIIHFQVRTVSFREGNFSELILGCDSHRRKEALVNFVWNSSVSKESLNFRCSNICFKSGFLNYSSTDSGMERDDLPNHQEKRRMQWFFEKRAIPEE